MERHLKPLSKIFLALTFLSLNQSIVFAHHIGIEIMGREYEPQGVFQHIVLIVLTAGFFTFAIYGFVTFIKKFLPEEKRWKQAARKTQGQEITTPE